MENECSQIARWRGLADQYRLKAASTLSPGSRLAFCALAECADDVADRMGAGTFPTGRPTDGLTPSPAPDGAPRSMASGSARALARGSMHQIADDQIDDDP
jgi:hypothetical protein